jgi:hypothetical protein
LAPFPLTEVVAMSIRRLFGLGPDRRKTIDAAFDPIEIGVNTSVPTGFREFTIPPRRQAGAGLRLGSRHAGQPGRIGIVPFSGVKVP